MAPHQARLQPVCPPQPHQASDRVAPHPKSQSWAPHSRKRVLSGLHHLPGAGGPVPEPSAPALVPAPGTMSELY